MSLTFDQAIIRVSRQLQDTANVRWTTPELGDWLNDGLADFCRRAGLLKAHSPALAVAATTPANAFYTMPADFFELLMVETDDRRLAPVSLQDLPPSWGDDTGTPTHYVIDFLTEIRVWPYPSSAALTDLKVLYVKMPATWAGANLPGIPAAYHLALVYYAVAQAYLKDFQYRDPNRSAAFMEMYERELADATVRSSRKFDGAPMRVPYRNV